MRSFLATVSLALLVGCDQGNTVADLGSPDLVIRHINVVDVTSGRVVPDRLIAITDGRFTAVIDDPVSWQPGDDVHVIDGSGLYAIPGLCDMHTHVCWSDTNATLLLPALLRHGITGVRDMGGDLRIANAFKLQVQADPSLGPDIMACGPILDGKPPVFPDFTIPLDRASNIPLIIDSLMEHGAAFIKVYSLLEGSELQRLADHCRTRGIGFAGHLSELVDPERSIAMGQRSVEHLNRLDEIWNDDPLRIDSITALMHAHHTWSCPTLVVYQRKANAHEPAIRDTLLDALVPGLQNEWRQWKERRMMRYRTVQQHDSLGQRFQRQLALVKHLHDRGVRILAGSDLCGQPFVYPGVGLHDELALLVQAGLSNAEALRSATILPAEYLGQRSLRGSIEVGQQADLVILTADPLISIGNTREIMAVVHRGVLVPIERKRLPAK